MYRKNDLYRKINKIRPGTHLKITFGPKDTFTPFYLIGMKQAGTITFTDNQIENTIHTIKNTSKWDLLLSRVIEVATTKLFNPTWFSEQLYKGIENIEIIKDHPNYILTKR